MYKPKLCIDCNKEVAYKHWAEHHRTERHITNNNILNRKMEQKSEERKIEELKQTRLENIQKDVIEKFHNASTDNASVERIPVFKSKSNTIFNHHPNIPNNFRMLMLGESNCGKTVLLLKMILKPGFLDFNNLIIFSSTAEQSGYQMLQHGFNNNLSKDDIMDVFTHSEAMSEYTIEEICYSLRKPTTEDSITCQLSSSENEILHPSDIPTIRDCDGTTGSKGAVVKTLMIFDDLVCVKNQSLMAEYFVLGRHYNINTIYLTQSLIKVPKNCIRDNSNMFILFHLPLTDLRYLYTNLFKYLDDRLDENNFYNNIETALSTKYSHATYNKDLRIFIGSIIPTSNQTIVPNEQSDEE